MVEKITARIKKLELKIIMRRMKKRILNWKSLPELEIVVELGNLVPSKNLVSQKVFLILKYLQS